MRLLVSVRSGAEAIAALDGGADIIDAKEPDRGPLGAVTASTLVEIARAVPPSVPLSVALGDLLTPAAVTSSVGAIEMPSRRAPVYVKIGFAGVESADLLSEILARATTVARASAPTLTVIAVAYADYQRAGAPPPAVIAREAERAGASGILIDTFAKDGRDLLSWMGTAELETWCAQRRTAGLLTALAGSLSEERIPEVCAARPDIIGLRAAACAGARTGQISAAKVARLKAALERQKAPAKLA